MISDSGVSFLSKAEHISVLIAYEVCAYERLRLFHRRFSRRSLIRVPLIFAYALVQKTLLVNIVNCSCSVRLVLLETGTWNEE